MPDPQEQKCHEEIRDRQRAGDFVQPCDAPASGWAWDDDGGLYPACEAHEQRVASLLSESQARERQLREAMEVAEETLADILAGQADWTATQRAVDQALTAARDTLRSALSGGTGER